MKTEETKPNVQNSSSGNLPDSDLGPLKAGADSPEPPRRRTAEELRNIAQRIRKSVGKAFRDHPNVETGVVEEIDEEELKP